MARRSDHSRGELRQISLASCRDIVREGGLSMLKMRNVAERIGYTVGTLYLVFENLDDMVEQLNIQTLQALFEHCVVEPPSGDPANTLMKLANLFNEFILLEGKLWESVMLYRFPPDHERSEEYRQSVAQLLGLITEAIASYYVPANKELQMHDARVLWASFYGVYALDASNRQAKIENIESLTASVVDFFIAAKTSMRRN